MLVELLCLLVFSLRLVHYARVIPRDKFWKDPKNICIIAIVTVGGAYRYVGKEAKDAAAERWVRGPLLVGCRLQAPPLQTQLVSLVTPGGFCHLVLIFS